MERGWFADDFSVTGGGATTWSDDVEGGANGWTATGGTFTDTTGAGWHIDCGTQVKAQYYLAEWRNFDGFDKGLKYAYDTMYSHEAWKVDRISYNAPGMLVWYRDTALRRRQPRHRADDRAAQLRRQGRPADRRLALRPVPAAGRGGGEGPVDAGQPAQPAAVVERGVRADTRRTRSRSAWRRRTSRTASTARTSARSRRCRRFTDAKGWYPGIEIRNGAAYARDNDASVVVPSRGNAPYTTRVVNPDGTPATEYYGVTLGGGAIVLGTGNPGDQGVSYGVSITIKRTAPGQLVRHGVRSPRLDALT